MIKAVVIGLGALVAATLAAGSQAIQPPAAPVEPSGKVWVASVLSGVHVSDLKTGKTVAKFDTGIIPHMMLLSPDKKRLLVSHIGSQSITVFDTASVSKIKDLLVGEIPDNAAHRKLGAARMARAGSCYECHKTVPTGTAPNAMAWTPDGRALMVSETKTRSLVWLDPESGKTLKRHIYDIPDRVTPAHVMVHPISQEIWVFHRFEDFLGDRLAKTHPIKPAYAGQHKSWVTVHSPGFGRETARLQIDWEVPSTGVFSPDGRWLYVSYRSSNRIGVFDTRQKKLLRSYTTAEAPTGLLLSPDGRELYVACPFSSPAVVQVIDAHTGELKVSMGVPPSPLMLAQDPATKHLFATLAGYNAVVEIDRENLSIVRQFSAGHQPLDLVLTP